MFLLLLIQGYSSENISYSRCFVNFFDIFYIMRISFWRAMRKRRVTGSFSKIFFV